MLKTALEPSIENILAAGGCFSHPQKISWLLDGCFSHPQKISWLLVAVSNAILYLGFFGTIGWLKKEGKKGSLIFTVAVQVYHHTTVDYS